MSLATLALLLAVADGIYQFIWGRRLMAISKAVLMQAAAMQSTDTRDPISLIWRSLGLAVLVVAEEILR